MLIYVVKIIKKQGNDSFTLHGNITESSRSVHETSWKSDGKVPISRKLVDFTGSYPSHIIFLCTMVGNYFLKAVFEELLGFTKSNNIFPKANMTLLLTSQGMEDD